VKQVLDDFNLQLNNICSLMTMQLFMKDYDKGLQTFFKSINKYAEYVLCTAYSFNHLREKAASIVPEVVDYVGILQQLYIL
jgi:hypothetical protein